MRQNKLLLLLVLLMTAVSGAWADSFSADAYAANATLNGVSVSTDQTVTINEGITVTVNNGLSIQSNATLTVTGGGTLVVNGANGADGQDEGLGVDPDMGEEVWVKATPGGNGYAGIVIDNGGNLIISNATIIAVGGKGGQGGKIEDESYAANGADGNGFASFPTIDGAVMSHSTNGTDYTEYASGDKTLYRYMKAVKVAPPTYKITVAEGTEDVENWDVPKEATAGSPVTATYKGEKKVKSVKAVKKAAEPAATDLATITADYEAKDGETLTGTLASNVKISIADGATVTLKDVNITNLGNNCDWAGISCPGDATLVLEGTNTVCAGRDGDGNNNYPGIYIASGKTLTIQGDGTLTAYSDASEPFGAGIGGGYGIACGNIVINSGTITATGGAFAAGIGSGNKSGSCGNITINGGTITATGGNFAAGIGSGNNSGSCGTITISGGTVEATGGNSGAGIGGGNKNGACGTITITSGVTRVKATKGTNAPNSIGKGEGGQDITVNIENGANVIMTPVTVTWNSPNFNSNPYTRDGVTLTAGNAASGNNFYDFGEKTFTNTIGKFTKIEIVCGDFNLDGWAQQKVGEYQEPEGPSYEIFKLTWTGNAESVTIPAKYVYSIQSITFTIQ